MPGSMRPAFDRPQRRSDAAPPFRPSRPMIVLGWREWLTLPELGIARLRAKVDTGARTSALHVDTQWRFSDAGAPWVGFRLTPGKAGTDVCEAAAPILDEREVADSGGRRSRRVFIGTLLRMAG